MAANKYGKYIMQGDKLNTRKFSTFYQTQEGLNFGSWEGTIFSGGIECITKPWNLDPYPMKHETADQFMAFFGANGMDMYDFDAQIEFSLGEEGEKHIFTVPTAVFIPRGFVHCPLDFKKVNKPVMMVNITFGYYTRNVLRDGKWSGPMTYEQEGAMMTAQEKKERGIDLV